MTVTMRAAVYHRYGPPDVVRIEEVPKPSPAAGEVLVRVHATTVEAADWRVRAAEPFLVRLFFGLMRPKKNILGVIFSGVVEEAGSGAAAFQPGDGVFGLSDEEFGGHGEFMTFPADGVLAKIPEALDFKEAAAVPFGALSALYFLRDVAGVREGHKVMIYGASGAVGTAAVQLAKHFGAHVTGVCSGPNAELVRGLGAERVLDYTKDDFASAGENYDWIFDTVGKTSFARCRAALAPDGMFMTNDFGLRVGLAMIQAGFSGKQKVKSAVAKNTRADMEFVRDLLAEGAFRPVIDSEFTFDQITAAHERAQSGRKRGAVVVRVR